MKNKRIIIYILLIAIIIITISYLSVEITKLFYETKDVIPEKDTMNVLSALSPWNNIFFTYALYLFNFTTT